jgi:DNA replication and repair protein RecF
MHLRKLSLINFKNYAHAELTFNEKFNCFLGNNGEGKTNILDAIHYLSFCKSYFNPVDAQNILFNEQFFVIQGDYVKNDKEENIYCALKRNEKKQFKRNKKEYERLSDHIGFIPLVMISPSDSELITEGSEIRRRFIDSVISQYDKEYLEALIRYNKILAQRNALLKTFFEERFFDPKSLEVYDEMIIAPGEEIFRKRKEFIADFSPIFQNFYNLISNQKEAVELAYDSDLEGNSFRQIIAEQAPKDRVLLYTSAGVHKDDLNFIIKGFPVKKMASQGQQKTYLLALKLAQFAFLKRIKNMYPLLLLDDIFEKLDETRVTGLMKIVSSEEFGQIFVTDTHLERLPNLLFDLNVPYKAFRISEGNIAVLA